MILERGAPEGEQEVAGDKIHPPVCIEVAEIARGVVAGHSLEAVASELTPCRLLQDNDRIQSQLAAEATVETPRKQVYGDDVQIPICVEITCDGAMDAVERGQVVAKKWIGALDSPATGHRGRV